MRKSFTGYKTAVIDGQTVLVETHSISNTRKKTYAYPKLRGKMTTDVKLLQQEDTTNV